MADQEEREKLLQSKEVGATSYSWDLVLGTLLAAASLLSLLLVIFSAFVTNFLWPALGLLLLVAHGLLLGSSKHSAAALCFEAICYFWLLPTYLFRSFIVPSWWWNTSVILFILPALVLLVITIATYLSRGSLKEKLSTFGLGMIFLVCLLVGVLLLIAANFSNDRRAHDALREIRDYVQDLAGPLDSSTLGTVGTCDMATSECSMKDFQDGWTTLKPGGATGCLVGDFEFVVYKGDPRKLLFHLQGGGACWNWLTFLGGMCSTTAPQSITGIYNVSNPANPFYGWSLVDVPYCSGDIHGGGTENFWILADQTASAWKSQSGYANVNAVMDWLKLQFHGDDPALRTLTHFVVSGESAGSLGVQIWGTDILRRLEGHYEPKTTYLIGDSFVGAIPDRVDLLQRQVITFWRFCESGLVPKELKPDCRFKRLLLADFVEDTLQDFPSVRYLMVDSKFDSTQIAFGDALVILDNLFTLVTQGIAGVTIFTNETFYEQLSGDLLTYSAYPQFSAYLVDATEHTYTPSPIPHIFATTPAGPKNDCSSPDVGERLLDWLSPSRGQPPYQCYDTQVDAPNWTGLYCDTSLPWQAAECTPSE